MNERSFLFLSFSASCVIQLRAFLAIIVVRVPLVLREFQLVVVLLVEIVYLTAVQNVNKPFVYIRT